MEIEKTLYNEIKEYCKLNNIKIATFINKLLRDAFNREKYGDKPFFIDKKNEYSKPIGVVDIVKEKHTDNITKIENGNIIDTLRNTLIADEKKDENKIKKRKLN